MKFYFSYVTVFGIICYSENARGCTASRRLRDAIQPRMSVAVVSSADDTRPRAPYPYPPYGRAHLRMGVAHPLCAPPGRGNDEPLRGSLIDSAESMSGSGSGSAALNR